MYFNYNGEYLEGFIQDAKDYMKLSKKYKHALNLRLFQYADLEQMKEDVEEALSVLEQINASHYRKSLKYADRENLSDVLDKCFATDDILWDYTSRTSTLIDWTINTNAIDSKVLKHKNLEPALHKLADYFIVVCILNIGVWEDLFSEDLARALYKVMKAISEEVCKKDYQGFLIIDAKDLI
jgi:DNA-binding FrmR family transcriptional regulator